jgi:hypothetical protein
MITRSFDERDGIITVKATGRWTRAEVDDHFSELRRLIEPIRAAQRTVLLLSDVTEAERQAPELEQHIRLQQDRTFRAGDRIAILTGSMDDKAHVRSVLGAAEMATFSSRLPAEMWLVETDLKRPA